MRLDRAGTPVQASPEALGRLARALASRAPSAPICSNSRPARPGYREPPARTRQRRRRCAVVAALADPAYGLDPLWNACCWNEAAERLFFGWLDRRPSAQSAALRLPGRERKNSDPRLAGSRAAAARGISRRFGHRSRDAEVKAFIDSVKRRKCSPVRTGLRRPGRRTPAGGLRIFDHPKMGVVSLRAAYFQRRRTTGLQIS